MRFFIAGASQYESEILDLGLSKLYSILHEAKDIEKFVQRHPGHNLLVDSGAHSWNKKSINPVAVGFTVDTLPLSSEALARYEDIIDAYHGANVWFVEFDVYGNLPRRVLDRAAERIRVKLQGYGSDLIRVYHPTIDGGSMDAVREWKAQGYPLIGVSNNTIQTMDHFFAITGSEVRVHGFALMKANLLERFPFYSVDSTSAMAPGRFGGYTNARFTHQSRGRSILLRRPELFAPKRTRIIRALCAAANMQQHYTALWKKRGVEWPH